MAFEVMKWQMAYRGKLKASATKYIGPEPVLGITPPTVCNELQHWANGEQCNQQ